MGNREMKGSNLGMLYKSGVPCLKHLLEFSYIDNGFHKAINPLNPAMQKEMPPIDKGERSNHAHVTFCLL